MYNNFDSFIRVETWHTTHPLDDQRFYQALDKVVRHKDFSPPQMADYFRNYLGKRAAQFADAIDHREEQAETIRDFLTQTKLP